MLVEFTLSLELNHAFAVHHWTGPAWHLSAAGLATHAPSTHAGGTEPALHANAIAVALGHWTEPWQLDSWWDQPGHAMEDAEPSHTEISPAMLPRSALLPALLRPLLASEEAAAVVARTAVNVASAAEATAAGALSGGSAVLATHSAEAQQVHALGFRTRMIRLIRLGLFADTRAHLDV